MADERRCQCTVVFEADAKPVVDRSSCRVHELEERIRADWDTIESRGRMVTGALVDLAVEFERMGNSFLLPTSNTIEAARFDAARHAWLEASKIARARTFDDSAQGSATLDGEVVRKEIEG